jgi:hypothetical protein
VCGVNYVLVVMRKITFPNPIKRIFFPVLTCRYNTGEGIQWGESLGAELQHMASYQGHASLISPMGPLLTWGVVVNGAVLVNREGNRFGCELVGYSKFAEEVSNSFVQIVILQITKSKHFGTVQVFNFQKQNTLQFFVIVDFVCDAYQDLSTTYYILFISEVKLFWRLFS